MELSLRQEIQLTGSGGCVTGVSLWTAGQVAVVWTSESQPSRMTESKWILVLFCSCVRVLPASGPIQTSSLEGVVLYARDAVPINPINPCNPKSNQKI